jgi:hypothetical protein
MTQKTLLDILTSSLAYDNSLAVYAERIGGEFRPESPARIGQRWLKNGGVEDDLRFFTNCKHAEGFINLLLAELDPDEIGDEELCDAALELIDYMNALVEGLK